MAGRGTDIQLGGNYEFNSSTKNGQENLKGLKETITQKKDEVIIDNTIKEESVKAAD